MIFTAQEWAAVRQGRKIAQLMPVLRDYSSGGLARARRVVITRDEDGTPVGFRREMVMEDHRPVVLTVLTVEAVEVHGKGTDDYRAVTLADARACGHRTVSGMRDAWKVRHPRSELAKLIWFRLGDHRDRDKFLNWTGRAGGDYTYNPRRAIDPDAPVLSREELERQTKDRRSVELLSERYQLLGARDGLARYLRELQALVQDEDVEKTLRRLERELSVLDRKLFLAA